MSKSLPGFFFCYICHSSVSEVKHTFMQRQKILIFLPVIWPDARLSLLIFLKRKDYYFTLSYSWHFSCYSMPIHWLVNGHMTSNNETVSHQMPWAGNIAKTMTSNGKQFTVTREMLTTIARDRWNLSAVFKFCFVLFCYITNHLMTGP